MYALKLLAVAVAAAFLWGCSGGSSPGGGGNPPPPVSAPTGLQGTASNGTTVDLDWNGSGQFTGYRVFRDDVEIATTTATNYSDTGLSPSTAYRYFVRGETASGLSQPSSTITVTTPGMLSLSLAKLADPASRSHLMVRDIEFDSAGNIFITGGAFSSNFPTTAGAYDRTFATGGSSPGTGGPSDAFVMKFSRSGQLLWSTFLGGPNFDRAYALEIAPDGGVIVAGRAGQGFPTTAGVVQPNFAGDSGGGGLYGKQDGFIAKISANGSTLLWSTYFGDPEGGAVRDVGVDANNRIYIAGWFFAGLSHITPDARQGSVNGQHDLGYARLSANASTVEYATYLGGNEPSGSTPGTPSVFVTPSRNVYLLIEEGGSGAPTTSNAYQPNKSGGDDFLIARFNSSDQLVFATYLGGSGDEDLETHNITVDASGRAAISGVSKSGNYPTTPQAYQPLDGGGSNDGVVSILSADGSNLVASTYIGGGGTEDMQGIEFGPDGLLYVAGGTRSSGLRTTANAEQTNFAGVMDAMIVAFTPDLRGASYLTYFGGGDSDIARALDVAADGAVAAGGLTSSFNFPVSAGGSTAPNGPFTGWWGLFLP